MSHKEYSGLDYVCQELRKSIDDYFSKKAGGTIDSSYKYHSAINEGEIKYFIAGLEATLFVKKKGKQEAYEMKELIRNSDGETVEYNELIKPERSGSHRISGSYLKKFAEERLQKLRVVKKLHRK